MDENYIYPKGYKPIKRRSQIKSWLDLELYHRYKADRAVKTIRKIREIRAKYEGQQGKINRKKIK